MQLAGVHNTRGSKDHATPVGPPRGRRNDFYGIKHLYETVISMKSNIGDRSVQTKLRNLLPYTGLEPVLMP